MTSDPCSVDQGTGIRRGPTVSQRCCRDLNPGALAPSPSLFCCLPPARGWCVSPLSLGSQLFLKLGGLPAWGPRNSLGCEEEACRVGDPEGEEGDSLLPREDHVSPLNPPGAGLAGDCPEEAVREAGCPRRGQVSQCHGEMTPTWQPLDLP